MMRDAKRHNPLPLGDISLCIDAENASAKMILPITIHIDVEEEDTEGARFVWVVYTDNPSIRLNAAADLPYLAHYVTMDGEYLYSLATIRPGDAAGEAGFDAAYVFEFMVLIQI